MLKRLKMIGRGLRCFRLAFTAAAVAALASCSGCSGSKDAANRHRSVDARRFAVVKQPLTIERGFRKAIYDIDRAGTKAKPQTLSFKVVNRNIESLSVEEWRRNETDNIIVSVLPVQEGEKDQPLPDRTGWLRLWPGPEADHPKDGGPVRRAPVMLAPNNSLLLDIPLVFPADYKLPDNAANFYLWVKAELNLRSVQAKPLVFQILVREKGRKVKEIIITD